MEVEVELPDDTGLSCRRKHSRNDRTADANPEDTWAQSGDFEKASMDPTVLCGNNNSIDGSVKWKFF